MWYEVELDDDCVAIFEAPSLLLALERAHREVCAGYTEGLLRWTDGPGTSGTAPLAAIGEESVELLSSLGGRAAFDFSEFAGRF